MLHDYQTSEELARTPSTVLLRAKRVRDGLSVLITATSADQPSPADATAFEREFETRKGLDVRGVPRPLELLRSGQHRALVALDPGGQPLSTIIASGQIDLPSRLRVAIQIARVLADLHAQDCMIGVLEPGFALAGPQGEVWLASLARGGTPGLPPSQVTLSEGDRPTLPYVSPELTGRLKRAVDHRCDLYSLGVVLYELVSGSPPFVSSDAQELVHWHLARTPDLPIATDPRVEAALAAILHKLLAKTPEDRYQSAAGVVADIESCLAALHGSTTLDGFLAGTRDVSSRFMIPERLYGRDEELLALTRTLDRAAAGEVCVALIEGPSGVGKTALIEELYRPLARARGRFTSGKFDQVARSVPFGALIQAFGGLLRQLLAEPEDRLAHWRHRLAHELGSGAAVLAEVLPELVDLLGEQPSAPALAGVEALNRFRLAFVRFVAALASLAHPLVLFLDDLQWADAATLGLLKPLLTSGDVRHVLIVGTYRGHEVGADHPLRQTVADLEATSVATSSIRLEPLRLEDVQALVADTLRQPLPEVATLASLVHTATQGNPFFLTQFLRGLYRDRLVWFDSGSSVWRFSLDGIAMTITNDDVVDLLSQRIQRMSAGAQHALTIAAFLGGRVDEAALVASIGEAEVDTIANIREAVAEGLLVPTDRAYRFLHDRVQQAALELVPPGEHPVVHLTIGRRLLRVWARDTEPERIFDIVGHLAAGQALLRDDERLSIAALAHEAGRRARSATAWDAAATYFDLGVGLLLARPDHHYDMAFPLHLDAAECHFLARRFETAQRYIDACVALARGPLDLAQVHALRMVTHENRSQYEDAVTCGRQALDLLGVALANEADAQRELDREIDRIEALRAGRPIDRLVELPAAHDPSTQLAMRVLTSLWSPTYIIGHQTVARLISALLVRLSLEGGNTEDSAYGYVTHAITIGPFRGDYPAAFEWGRLALAVNARFDDRQRRAKIHQQFHAHVCLWRRPFSECVAHAKEAARSGLEGGDLIYAGYGAVTESWAAWPIANDLDAFVQGCRPALDLAARLQLADFRSALQVMVGTALALQGRTAGPSSLDHEGFSESDYLERFGGEVFFRTFYYTAKAQLAVLFEDTPAALTAVKELDRGTVPGTIWPVWADFWGGLAFTAAFAGLPLDAQRRTWARLVRAQESLAALAGFAPENFKGYWLMLSAEMARVSLRFEEAARLATEAIAYAAQIHNVQQEALANEIAARAVAQHEGAAAARPFLIEAVRGYEAWGAVAKVARLRSGHSLDVDTPRRDLIGGVAGAVGGLPQPLPPAALTSNATLAFDVATLVKIAQAMAMEMRLPDLLTTLMRLAIENAGAQRGLFIKNATGQLTIEAEGSVSVSEVATLQGASIDDSLRVAASVVQYVRNTHRSVVVADALRDERFASDPYVQSMRPRSLMATPVMHQGRLIGVLYLEHGLAPDVFTAERDALIQVVAAQAAIALENATLYREVSDEARERRRAEEILRELTEGTATALGEGFFRSLVRHLASALRVRYAFVTECREQRTRARSLAFWKGDRIADDFEYDVANTPCKAVFEGRVCAHPRDVQRSFPDDQDLADLGAESYLGAPMVDASGQVIGHIAVLDTRPLEDDARAASVLSIFSARAGAELERLKAEQQLREALIEVEGLKNRLQAENVYLQDEIRGEHNFDDMVGRSSALVDVFRRVERVAPTDATVLITGETGTGKELIARAVHSRGVRKHRPLVKVNCGAISSGLVESELFGHVKGAFTGAIDKRVGRFELADGGTIFLDEVGELPLDAQVKLLRVLQEQEFESVGSSRTVRVNVRVIAATNRNLDQAVQDGRFRADLYFRLNVVTLRVPPLRERQSDIPLLVTFFVTKFAKQFGKTIDAVSQETMRFLSGYAWPGNIRELQNVVERAVVLSRGPVLTLGPDLLPDERVSTAPSGVSKIPVAGPAAGAGDGALSLDETARRHIVAVLERVNYVIEGTSGAARVLSLHPNTLRSRMKKLGIALPRARHSG